MPRVLPAKERRRLEAMMAYENQARARGFCRIAGIDEAGRGPLAGPVVAAACILPEGALIRGINDSKQLLPSERYDIFKTLVSLDGIDYGIGIVDSLVIDQINILQASFQAMIIAISHLSSPPDFILVDGNKLPFSAIPGEAIVEGDGKSQSIAAASIIAKETRDEIMRAFHLQWPQYGFNLHKGYSTEEHLLAIEKYGPCPIHRLTYDPLRKDPQLDLFEEKI